MTEQLMNHVYNVAEILAILESVVAERPEGFRYEDAFPKIQMENQAAGQPTTPTCLYFHEGQPACLVGQVLHRIGFGPDAVIEGKPIMELCRLAPAIRGVLSEDAITMLSRAQAAQDNGGTWQEAADVARLYLGQ
jgi:hypothetical protein